MPVEGRERGVRSPYNVRFGITNPTYEGVNTQKAPMSLRDSEGPTGINLRIIGGRPINRGGQTRLNADTIQTIHGFYDTTSEGAENARAGPAAPHNAFYAMGAILESSPALGEFLHVGVDGVFLETTIEEASTASGSVVDYGGSQYGAVVVGTTATVVALPGGTTVLFTLPSTGVAVEITGMVVQGTNLYVAWVDDQGTGGFDYKISKWDGASLTEDYSDTSADHRAIILGLFGTTPYAGFVDQFNSATNTILKRVSAGTWSSISLPSATWFKAHSFAVLGLRLYVIGSDDTNTDGDEDVFRIYSTDGSTATLDRTIANPAVPVSPAGVTISQLGVVGTDLYYWYHDGVGGVQFSVIGKYNGSTWTDTFKDIGADLASESYKKILGFVISADGADVVALDDIMGVHIWQSPGPDISGTWTRVLSYTSTGMFYLHSLQPPTMMKGVVS